MRSFGATSALPRSLLLMPRQPPHLMIGLPTAPSSAVRRATPITTFTISRDLSLDWLLLLLILLLFSTTTLSAILLAMLP